MAGQQPHHAHLPIAIEIMQRKLITLTPELPIASAIRILLKNKISGAPVLDPDGKMIGICSELDCLRVLSSGEFYSDDYREEGVVGDVMSKEFTTVGPNDDIYSLAQFFLTHSVRRLPVMEEGELLGQLSRRDVLRSMDELGKKSSKRRRYPDYREPAGDVGPRHID